MLLVIEAELVNNRNTTCNYSSVLRNYIIEKRLNDAWIPVPFKEEIPPESSASSLSIGPRQIAYQRFMFAALELAWMTVGDYRIVEELQESPQPNQAAFYFSITDNPLPCEFYTDEEQKNIYPAQTHHIIFRYMSSPLP